MAWYHGIWAEGIVDAYRWGCVDDGLLEAGCVTFVDVWACCSPELHLSRSP